VIEVEPSDFPPEFGDLLVLATDAGLTSASEAGGHAFIPFALVQSPSEGVELHRFAADTLEASIEAGREYLASSSGLQRAAFVWDGRVGGDEGPKTDAVLFQLHERGFDESLLFAQRYRPSRGLRRFKTIGDPMMLGAEPPLFTD
jgi:hypothetical protein